MQDQDEANSPQSEAATTAPQPEQSPQQPQTGSSLQEASAPQPNPVLENSNKKSRKKPALIIAAVLALLLGGSAAAYTVINQNSPEAIWQKALDTTSERFESFVTSEQTDSFKGGTVDGSFKLSAPLVADGTISGEWYESNLSLSSEVGVAGVRAKSDIRAIAPEPGEVPDVFVRVSGLEGLDGLLGQTFGGPEAGALLQEINNSWYKIDRTLIEQGINSQNGSTDPTSLELTPEEITDIGTRSAAVLDERLFTDDSDKAVVVVDEYIGEEVFDGNDTYKYRVKPQKQQLKDFVVAMKDELAQTKFKDLVLESAGDGQTYEEALEIDRLLEEIEELDFENATAEAWVDAKFKFIRNIRITNNEQGTDQSAYIDFGLDYKDGDELPFYIRLVQEKEGKLELGLAYNEKAKSVTLSFDFNADTDEQKITAVGELKIVSSDSEITVEEPAGAKNILELLGLVGLDGSTGLEDSEASLPFDDFEL